MDLTSTLIAAILIYLIFVLLQWAIKRNRTHNLFKRYGIPGPKPEFFGGNMYQLRKEPTQNNIIESWLKQYGDVFGYYMGELPYVVVKDLEILKQILNKDFNQFTNRPDLYITGPLRGSLIGLKDKRWKDVRNIITPMFTSGKMKNMFEIMTNKADLTVQLILEKAQQGKIFDIYATVQGLTLDVIATCALAMNTRCQQNEKDELLIAVRNLLRLQHHKLVELAILFPFIGGILETLSDYTSFGKNQSFIIDHLKHVIQTRRQNPEFKSVDILQALLDKSKMGNSEEDGLSLTENEVIDNAFVVFGAGLETTATSLAYTMYLLVKHPEVQERLYQEIIGAEECNYTTIQNLPYLDQVYSEALRIYPPVTGFVTRTVDQDYTIGSYTFPKGCHVLAPTWNIHHDPDLWPDPWKFDPERFSPSNKSSIKSMSYIPFGTGPRNCVGARFALLESKMLIYKLIKKVRLEACDKTDPLPLITVTVLTSPEKGVWVKAVPREHS